MLWLQGEAGPAGKPGTEGKMGLAGPIGRPVCIHANIYMYRFDSLFLILIKDIHLQVIHIIVT